MELKNNAGVGTLGKVSKLGGLAPKDEADAFRIFLNTYGVTSSENLRGLGHLLKQNPGVKQDVLQYVSDLLRENPFNWMVADRPANVDTPHRLLGNSKRTGLLGGMDTILKDRGSSDASPRELADVRDVVAKDLLEPGVKKLANGWVLSVRSTVDGGQLVEVKRQHDFDKTRQTGAVSTIEEIGLLLLKPGKKPVVAASHLTYVWAPAGAAAGHASGKAPAYEPTVKQDPSVNRLRTALKDEPAIWAQLEELLDTQTKHAFPGSTGGSGLGALAASARAEALPAKAKRDDS